MGLPGEGLKIPHMATVKPRLKGAKPRYYFREWRKFRGYTQEQLAEMVGLSAPGISQLETGKQGFTDSTLEVLAEALACRPGDLLMRNPLDDESVWSIWDHIDEADRPQVLRVLQTYAKDGTNG